MTSPSSPPHPEGTTAVRAAHRFDVDALHRYLTGKLEGLGPTLDVRQFEGGQSNPTFVLTSGDKRWVLRKKPPGKLLPSAHQIEREHAIFAALARTNVPVPKVYLLCEDPSVIGTPFFVMEHVVGRVFRNPGMAGSTREERTAVYRAMADTLARIHGVPFREVGLGELGKPEGYIARQISRWTKQYEASRTDDLPAMPALSEWLTQRLPEKEEVALVHGDFRLENLVIHPTEPRVIAVLDWELATLGHPLADLGYNCMAYHIPAGSEGRNLVDVNLEEAGIPTEEEFVAEYCRAAGRDVPANLRYFTVFALFRSAAILQGVYKRGLDGNASSETALKLGAVVSVVAGRAWELAKGMG
jgi:aminoglycoside phosphotransferase (APT) family kinase protein